MNLKMNNEFDLLIHESLLILRDRPELNSQQSSIPLVLFWCALFCTLGTQAPGSLSRRKYNARLFTSNYLFVLGYKLPCND